MRSETQTIEISHHSLVYSSQKELKFRINPFGKELSACLLVCLSSDYSFITGSDEATGEMVDV